MSNDDRLKLSQLRRESKLGGGKGKAARKVLRTLGKGGVDKEISKKGVRVTGSVARKGTLSKAIRETDFKSKAAKKVYERKLGKQIGRYQDSSSVPENDISKKTEKRGMSELNKQKREIRDQFGGGYKSDTGPSRDAGASSPRDSV